MCGEKYPMDWSCARKEGALSFKYHGKVSTFWLGLVPILWSVLIAGCSRETRSSQAVTAIAVPVRVATVTQKTVPIEIEAIGNAEPYSTVYVKSQVTGVLEKIHFIEGQDVKVGDSLFTIDRRPFEAALRQAEATLARETAQARNARAEAERFAKLFQEGVISKQQHDQALTDAEALEAAVRADLAAVERAQLELDYCSIRSPIDGRTGSLMVHSGNVVKANDLTLVAINRVTPIYVSFSIPEQYLAQVKKHIAVRRLHVEALPAGNEPQPAHGQLTFVDNTVDAATGTIRLKATFPNQDRRLWPGQFVRVKLRLAEEPGVLVVPSEAVQTGQEGQYVFVVRPDLTAESRPVVVSRAHNGESVITKGLQAGETVVTDGHLRLAPGAKVEVKAGLEPTAGRSA